MSYRSFGLVYWYADYVDRDRPKWPRIIPNAGEHYLRTPLHFAAELGDVGAVKMLLEGGAQANAICDYGRSTPLHLAISPAYCSNKRPHGPCTNRCIKIRQERTPIGLEATIKVLLENGADVELRGL